MKCSLIDENGEDLNFDTLHRCLITAWSRRVTGEIKLSETNEVIKLRKGKRPGVKPGSWVPCDTAGKGAA